MLILNYSLCFLLRRRKGRKFLFSTCRLKIDILIMFLKMALISLTVIRRWPQCALNCLILDKGTKSPQSKNSAQSRRNNKIQATISSINRLLCSFLLLRNIFKTHLFTKDLKCCYCLRERIFKLSPFFQRHWILPLVTT